MRDSLTDIIRVGKVSAVDAEKGTAKVTFEDRDGNVSPFLFITVPCTLKDKFFCMPSIGERVAVVYDPGAPSAGHIIGSFYADSRLPPFPDKNKFYINFEDGTLIEYDKKLNRLTISITAENETSADIETASDINVKSNGKIKIQAAKEVEISCDNDITVKTGANVNIAVTGNASIKADGSMSIESLKALRLKGKEKEIIL